jgi:GxxExxY protein
MSDARDSENHGETTHGEHGEQNVFPVARSVLSSREDQLMARIIGAAIAVHREFGPGFLESIYKRAMSLELSARGLAFERERGVRVKYRGADIPGQRLDLIVEKLVVVELKSVQRVDQIHIAQVISYLKTTGLRAGLLINFRVPVLQQGLKRIVLTP